ncbi:hypothetical protein [Thalassomonas actiniarum]|uniref:Uncharacterized protein n=1 Tax=Thalassomonas actiniarum TaxID=485447 RepID=A0AAE9YQH2_9GAMM|nr:hypothetical protein [Thalassomonas actiniarum]WDD99195.1 hypothetical protein SG35_000450 [Thalassomonas actiniarum]
MHPFSLKKESTQAVTGGLSIPGLSEYLKEDGGPITMAIPEGGYDPRDFVIS